MAAEDRDQVGPDANFSVVRHGFDRNQVRQHIATLAEAVRQAEAEREQAQDETAELRGELELARREVAALTDRLDAVAGHDDAADRTASEQATRALEVARSQAREITARAEAAADYTWSAAEQASAALRDRYQRMLAELETQQSEIHAAHESIMSSAKEQVAEMTTEAERRRQEIDEEAERDRVRIDREFSESMATKREELRTEIEQRRAASVEEADRRLRAADEESWQRIATATAKVNKLTSVRDQLAARLRDTQGMLDENMTLLEPVDGEQDADVQQQLPLPEPPEEVAPVEPLDPPEPDTPAASTEEPSSQDDRQAGNGAVPAQRDPAPTDEPAAKP